jgi:hypothetical protein
MKIAVFILMLMVPVGAPALAAEETMLEVEPGLWRYESSYDAMGQSIVEKPKTYCVTPKESRRSLASLLDEVRKEGSCELSNIVHGDGVISADALCAVKELGMRAKGTITARYSRTQYDISANALVQTGGRLKLPISATALAKRIGDCGE